MHSLKDMAELILDEAKKAGADGAQVGIAEHESRGVSVRNQQVEDSDFSRSVSVGLCVFHGGASAVVRASPCAPDAVAGFVSRALSLAKIATPNPHERLSLPEEWPCPPVCVESLDLFDAMSSPSLMDLREKAFAFEKLGTCSGAHHVHEVSTAYSKTERVFAISSGLLSVMQSTMHSHSIEYLASDGNGTYSGGDGSSTVYADDLRPMEECAKRAWRRAQERLGAKPIASSRIPVIFHRDAAGAMVGSLLAAINASLVFNRATFLFPRMGERIMSPKITIMEEPHLVRRVGSTYLDSEGVATKTRPIVERGVLRTWIADIESATKLGIAPTGHAGGVRRTTLLPGDCSLDALLSKLSRTLVVTEIMGKGVNVATGDYSVSVDGLLFEHGELVTPVTGIAIAGNLEHMWKEMIPCSDMTDGQGSNRPSLYVGDMVISGR